MVLKFASGGLFGSRGGLLDNNQDFVSVSGAGFVTLNGKIGWHTFDGRIAFSSAGDGTGDGEQVGGQIIIPDNVTITRVKIFGSNGAGANVKGWLKERILGGAQSDLMTSLLINTWYDADIYVDTKKNTYFFYVRDDDGADTTCYVDGAIVEFERGRR